MTRFVIYDVFTDAAFGGNQLAVIPDATPLPEGDLQKIAREFNFSETTFVYPSENPDHTAKIRIFTPMMEIPFAGHPTIGTALALRDLGHQGDMVLELGIGPIPCSFDGAMARFTTAATLVRIAEPAVDLTARALGLAPDKISRAAHAPVQATIGLPFVFAELNDAAALDQCTVNIDAIREAAARHPAGLDFALYAYTRDGAQVNARMFAPLDNIPEDPATGSAAATLTMLLAQELGQPQSFTIIQGEKMGRRSVIHARSDGNSSTISGQAVKTMEGQLTYD